MKIKAGTTTHRNCALRTPQVSIRRDSQSDGNNFCCNAYLGYLLTTDKIVHRRIRAHNEQLLEFERDRNIGLKEAG
ncbi:hypothetical protein TNCV_1814111 [Trichonephila clavipes]|nr:hypothetical protein TNCV_1814111 [Trichonephila clavipes]